MKLLRSLPVLTFVLVMLSIMGLSIAQESVGLFLMGGALAAISWYVTEGPRGRSLPRWVSNVLVIAASLYVVLELLQGAPEVLHVLGRFAVWLTLIKLYERRTPRDHAHLLALSLLLMLTGCLHTTDLLFGVVLLAYAALGVYVLLLYQLYAAYETGRIRRLAEIPHGYRLAPLVKPIIGRHPTAHFRSLAAGVGMAGVALGVVVFVLFPRGMGQGTVDLFPAHPASSSPQRSGLPSEINLLHSTRVTESRRPVMRVQLIDERRGGRPVRLPYPLLLRGDVLEQYGGNGRWIATESSSVRILTAGPDAFAPLREQTAGRTPAVTLHVEAFQEDAMLVSAFMPLALRAEREHRVRFDAATVALRSEDRRVWRYSVQSSALSFRRSVDDDLATARHMLIEAGQPRLLRGQSHLVNSRVQELAHLLLAEAGLSSESPDRGDTEAIERWRIQAAQAFMRHLQSPQFSYTLDLSDAVPLGDEGGRPTDPIEHFLFKSRRGHCEFFASAMAALCRNADIPSRLVIGYAAWEYDEAAKTYDVVEANAHAWTEVYLGDGRWATFDPTPAASLLRMFDAESGMAARLRRLYDRAGGAWSRTIVGYDAAVQADLARSTRDSGWSRKAAHILESVRDWMESVNRAFYFGPAGYIYLGFVGVVLIIAVLAIITVMRRSRRIRRVLHLGHVRGSEYHRMLLQLGFYLDVLETLSRAGIAKPDWQPPLEYAAALAQQNPDAAHLVREATETYYAARYGGLRLTSERRERARALVRRLAETLKVRTY